MIATISTIGITFLGTASAQPSSTRNHSSLAVQFGGRGDVWLFDCGEATQHQVQKSNVKMGKIKKIFITHTHGDHIFGLGPLMASCLNGAGGVTAGNEDERLEKAKGSDIEPLEIYGPLGTRAYIRNCLKYTYTLLEGRYVVHELRFPDDPDGDQTTLPCHTNELGDGRGILQTDGIWKDIFKDAEISVSAAPILHSVPCVGYVMDEVPVPEKMDPTKYLPDINRTKAPRSLLSKLQKGEDVTLPDGTVLKGLGKKPGRRIVILGDTYDPSPIVPIASEADVLIHEATNAHLPGIDPATKKEDTEQSVQARAMSRGHSTPQMAGRFAKATNAKVLLLNHFSARYRGDDDVNEESAKIMAAIRDLAAEEFGREVTCARDLMTHEVKPR